MFDRWCDIFQICNKLLSCSLLSQFVSLPIFLIPVNLSFICPRIYFFPRTGQSPLDVLWKSLIWLSFFGLQPVVCTLSETFDIKICSNECILARCCEGGKNTAIVYFSRLLLSSWHFVIAELPNAFILFKNAPLCILGSLNVAVDSWFHHLKSSPDLSSA